jgi:hypothetical protein
MAPTFNMAFFFASFSRCSRIRQKLQNAKVFAYCLRTNSKCCCQKINSKWPLNSRWLPKLNLIVKTTNHLFSKKKFRAVSVCLNKKILLYTTTKIRLYTTWRFFLLSFSRSSHGEPSKSASVKTASNEIQKIQFGQRQHTRNQNSQFQNS